MKGKKLLIVSLTVVCLGFVAGCNIFSWTHKAGGSSDPIALIADADSAYTSGDYAKAMEFYQKAIDADSTNSKARYGYINAYTRNSGLNIIDFAKNAGGQRSIADLAPGVFSNAPARAYYLLDDKTNPYGITMKKLEDLAIALIDKLEPIAQGKTDEKISPTDPELNLNLALGYLLRSIFLIIDPPSGNSGSVQYNVYRKDDGSYVLWSYQTNTELPLGATIPNKSQALAYLDKAIVSLNTAIENSVAKNSTGWADVKTALQNIRQSITKYNG